MRSEVNNSDCLEAMRAMPDNAFDLAIVDPPYGIGADKKNAHSGIRDNHQKWKAVNWDDAVPTAEYFSELRRVSINQIIWGGNYFLDHLSSTQCFLIWDKGVREFSLADAELAWTSFKSSVRINTIHRCQLQMEGNKFHPTQKPIKLYKWALQNYAKTGDTILDTHLGSGSSRIAAYDLGFSFTGFELDTDYFNAQEQRFADHIAQPRFTFEPTPVPEQQPMFATV
jgi:site-specific DNA-methyltransferase (adenine-specific)